MSEFDMNAYNAVKFNVKDRSNMWIVGEDTGLSSKAIWAQMNGVRKKHYDYPSDPSDLGRCLRLLERIPEWAPRIMEMAPHSKEWAALASHWDELKQIMSDEVGIDWSKGNSAEKTFDRMRELINGAQKRMKP